jgi:quercetin dioxygenase-like cupin family protein
MKITHHWAAGVYIKETNFLPGESTTKEIHDYDHFSTLASGTVRLVIDGAAQEVTGPKIFLIEAWKEHQVFALTAVDWHCTHASETALIGKGE